MPSHTRMKTIYLRGLLWLYLLGFGMVALSLEPGFLDFDNLPDTNFSCVGKVIGGYYADLETNCQMFHVCTIGQLDEPMDIRFLCLNGTVFDQETRVCERIDEVDCTKSEQFYSLNLELYGNTQPSVEENAAETDPPIVIKSTTSTTTTTSTTPRPKITHTPYYTTSLPRITTLKHRHYPIPSNQAPDIRFNPEEINIRLNAGGTVNIRTKPLSFQEQIFETGDSSLSHSNNKKAIIQHPAYPITKLQKVGSTTTQKTKEQITPADINYGFTSYRHHGDEDTENPGKAYQQYHYRQGQYHDQFKTSSSTPRANNYNPTTFRSFFQGYQHHTEKPQRLQLPLPLLPSPHPLQFSSPAPFTLSRHIETKRYTDNHPRIIISASASVSDASGRRLNYSLGTIGVSSLLEQPPKSYDDYKEHDVVLDPFYHDVPRVKKQRSKRQVKHTDVIKNEQEAVDVLKFLFDWYKSHEKNGSSTTVGIPITPEDITEINDRLMTLPEPEERESEITLEEFQKSELFQPRSKFNIIGDVLSVTEQPIEALTSSFSGNEAIRKENEDYVDDNYEPLVIDENEKLQTTEIVTTTSSAAPPVSKKGRRGRTRFKTNYELENITVEEVPANKLERKTPKKRNRGRYISLGYHLDKKAASSTTTNRPSTTEEVTTDEPAKTTFTPIITTEETETTTFFESSTSEENTNIETTLDDFVTTTDAYTNQKLTTESDSQQIATVLEPDVSTNLLTSTVKMFETTTVASTKEEQVELDATTITLLESTTEVADYAMESSTTLEPNLTSAESITEVVTTTRRPFRRRPGSFRSTKHRFSTEEFTPRSTRRRKPVIEEQIIEALTTSPRKEEKEEEDGATEASLQKSAKPTQAERKSTTPLSRNGLPRFVFNCFGRVINRFYSDPRDCRLFHYCTSGYTRNQLLDMKFVCDLGTYFDDKRLICTKDKPERCM